MTPSSVPIPAGSRVWFITGASRGLGRAFTEAALAAGDHVVGTARDVTPLADLLNRHPGRLLALSLDVTDRAAVLETVEKAVGAFGRLDIVVNNAGQFLFGMIEEATEEQIRAHLDVNLFGAIWVTQAVIPQLRAQGGGRILQVTSMGAGGGFASVGYYAAGKSALASVSEALAMEVASFGIKITNVQPGGYDTGLFTQGTTVTEENPGYAPLRAELARLWDDAQDADPGTAAPVIMELVDLPDPPKHLIVGAQSFDLVQQNRQARDAEYRAWEHLSRKAPS